MHTPEETLADAVVETNGSKQSPNQNAPEKIQEGDWVSINDPEIASLYFQGKAKVCMLIKGLVDANGKPVIIPEKRSSPRERASYEEQCRLGTRIEIRAVLYGAKADGSGWLEYHRSIQTGKLEKVSQPLNEPQFIDRTPAKKKTVRDKHANGNGNGNFAFPIRESIEPVKVEEDEIPRKRDRRRRREI